MKKNAKTLVVKIVAVVLILAFLGSMSISAFATDTSAEKREAERLWKSFLEATAVIETDEQYKPILDVADRKAHAHVAGSDFESGTGASRDVFVNMTAYERFLWYFTYVRPYGMVMVGDYQTYCSSLENWNSKTLGDLYYLIESYGNEEMLSAYRALMEWDYDYFLAHGAVYCFMEGKNSNELKRSAGVLTSVSAKPSADESVSSDEQENDAVPTDGAKQTKSQTAWGNVAILVKENAFSISLLLVLAGVGAAALIYRKRREARME